MEGASAEPWEARPREGPSVPPSQRPDNVSPDWVRHPGLIAAETGGQVRPTYHAIVRSAGQLAVGELVQEPCLGLLRVTRVKPEGSFVRISWADDFGPCSPAGRYSARQPLAALVPGPVDRRLIQRHIDRIRRHRGEVPAAIARLIAAHLQRGPHSALYDFVKDGGVRDRLFDELDRVHVSQPWYRPWVHSLASYCLSREDWEPLESWQPAAAADSVRLGMTSSAPSRKPSGSPLASKRIATDTVVALIDAAYDLGWRRTRLSTSSPSDAPGPTA
jgi:hypothetical protein